MKLYEFIGLPPEEGVLHKCSVMNIPKGMSCCAVLIHVNGVTETVLNAQYFSDVIDFSQLLQAEA